MVFKVNLYKLSATEYITNLTWLKKIFDNRLTDVNKNFLTGEIAHQIDRYLGNKIKDYYFKNNLDTVNILLVYLQPRQFVTKI